MFQKKQDIINAEQRYEGWPPANHSSDQKDNFQAKDPCTSGLLGSSRSS